MRNLALGLAATLIALVDVGVLALRAPATPVDVEDALARFHEERAGGDGDAGPLEPDPDQAGRGRETASPGPTDGSLASPTAPPGGARGEDPGNATDAGPDDPPPATSDGGSGERPSSSGSETPSRSPSPEGGVRAQEGVYVYDTSGYERIDAFGGSRHDYPEQTTISIRHTACGTLTRWQPIEERWDEFEICAGEDGSEMRSIVTYHEFMGWGEAIGYRCPAGSLVLPHDLEAGRTWTWTCTSEEGRQSTSTRIVELAQRTVGGETVDAVHLVHTSTLQGDPEGQRVYDVWFDRRTGLELEARITVDAQVGTPFGRTHYEERVERRLRSLRPRT